MANKLSDRNKILFYDFIVEYDASIYDKLGPIILVITQLLNSARRIKS